MIQSASRKLPLLLVFGCLTWPLDAQAAGKPKLAVVLGHDAPALEQFAADALCASLDKLFDIQVQPSRWPIRDQRQELLSRR